MTRTVLKIGLLLGALTLTAAVSATVSTPGPDPTLMPIDQWRHNLQSQGFQPIHLNRPAECWAVTPARRTTLVVVCRDGFITTNQPKGLKS